MASNNSIDWQLHSNLPQSNIYALELHFWAYQHHLLNHAVSRTPGVAESYQAARPICNPSHTYLGRDVLQDPNMNHYWSKGPVMPLYILTVAGSHKPKKVEKLKLRHLLRHFQNTIIMHNRQNINRHYDNKNNPTWRIQWFNEMLTCSRAVKLYNRTNLATGQWGKHGSKHIRNLLDRK